MVSASLIVEARRRAGLSQRALAQRLGVAHPEVARWERQRATPSLERLREIVAACGLELTLGLANADDSYDRRITEALARTPPQRLADAAATADRARSLCAEARGEEPPPPFDPLSVLRCLDAAGVRHVLVGEVAEVLHGSPLVPSAGVVTITPRAGERPRLDAAIAAAAGRPSGEPAASPVDATERWQLDAFGAELLVVPAPAGTSGHEDLRRDVVPTNVGDGLVVPVASMVDLVRIAEASTDTHDHARVVALRRTLELSGTTVAEAARAA